MGSWPGLRTDCEALLRCFQQAETVRFEEFASLWRQHRFHTVFYGKIRTPEQIKFTKEALALVWPYFLPPHTFQIRVGALYLLYGLYNTQLCQPKQKIRIALKDWSEVSKFQQELLVAQHYDAAYIFRKLRKDKAFYYTAMPKFLSFRTKKNMHDCVKTTGEFVDRSDRIAMFNSDDFLEETRNVHDYYQKMKCQISRDKSKPDKALNLIKDDFVTNFKNIVVEYQEWQKNKVEASLATVREEAMDSNEGPSQESEESGRVRTLAELKSRSYSAVPQASKSRRHRQVKLECSDSRSDRGKTSSPRAKKACRTEQSPRKKGALPRNTGISQVREGQCVQRLSMPVIAEEGSGEDGEEEDFGEPGANVCKTILQTDPAD